MLIIWRPIVIKAGVAEAIEEALIDIANNIGSALFSLSRAVGVGRIGCTASAKRLTQVNGR